MLCEAPNRLHWVRVRDALAAVDGWQRVCVSTAHGKELAVDTVDAERFSLVCARLDKFPALLGDMLPHEAGGLLAFWSRADRMIAIPEASSCLAGAHVEITPSVVIIEEGRNFELVAGDSSWRMRVFDARIPRPV